MKRQKHTGLVLQAKAQVEAILLEAWSKDRAPAENYTRCVDLVTWPMTDVVGFRVAEVSFTEKPKRLLAAVFGPVQVEGGAQ